MDGHSLYYRDTKGVSIIPYGTLRISIALFILIV